TRTVPPGRSVAVRGYPALPGGRTFGQCTCMFSHSSRENFCAPGGVFDTNDQSPLRHLSMSLSASRSNPVSRTSLSRYVGDFQCLIDRLAVSKSSIYQAVVISNVPPANGRMVMLALPSCGGVKQSDHASVPCGHRSIVMLQATANW